jgi:hypothetical protein
VDAHTLERHRDTRVTPNVPNLLVLGQVPGNELIPINPEPHARHLRTTVSVQRDEMCERARFDQLASAVRQRCHVATRSGGALRDLRFDSPHGATVLLAMWDILRWDNNTLSIAWWALIAFALLVIIAAGARAAK